LSQEIGRRGGKPFNERHQKKKIGVKKIVIWETVDQSIPFWDIWGRGGGPRKGIDFISKRGGMVGSGLLTPSPDCADNKLKGRLFS